MLIQITNCCHMGCSHCMHCSEPEGQHMSGNQVIWAAIFVGVIVLWFLFVEDIVRWFRENFTITRTEHRVPSASNLPPPSHVLSHPDIDRRQREEQERKQRKDDEYHLAPPDNYQSFEDQLRVLYTLAEEALPETDNVGKCYRRLITVRINENNMVERRWAWYSIAGFFSSPDCYAEHEIKDVIAWRYDD